MKAQASRAIEIADPHRAERERAVAEAIGNIRRIELAQGVTRAALSEIRKVMLDLAARHELFPPEVFAPIDPKNTIYRLSEDADHRFALYASCAEPGRSTPPHDHTTWAVIAGVHGEEHNKFYRRTDDCSVPGEGTVEVDHEFTVRPGTAVTLMPDDIHSIHLGPVGPHVNLHMYGLSLEHLPDRVAYDVAKGTYKVFPASPNIR
jgi:predicted metal-dependent enzyme (double-stranded beta helix superfamily)